MFEHGISEQWLRRAAWAIYVFFGLFALIGLGYVWYAAAGGQVFKALMGAGVALGSIGLGVGMHCAVQLGAVVADNTRSIAEVRRLIEDLRAIMDDRTPTLQLPTEGSPGPSDLVAAEARAGSRLRLIPPEALNGAQPSAPDATDTPGTIPNASEDMPEPLPMEQLRTAFRESVFTRDFASALEVGDAIAADFPQSDLAIQYRRLRPLIEPRVGARAVRPVAD